MRELPSGWAECKLQDCVKVLDNFRVPVNSNERNKRQGDVPYYGATGQVGWIDDYLFDEELLLIGEDGAPFFDKTKPIAYIIRGKSWVNNHAHVLRAISGLTSNLYLKYFLDQLDFHEYVNGTTRLKLTQGAMNEIRVKLPPFNEQHRLVAKLKKMLSRVDAAQARLTMIPHLLKRFRLSVLAAACSGRLTAGWRAQSTDTKSRSAPLNQSSEVSDPPDAPDLPGQWVYSSIDALLATNRRGMKTGPFGSMLKKKEHKPHGIPVLGIENIGFLQFQPGSKIHITKEKADELSEYEALPGDILISRSGTVGEVCVVPNDIGEARISTNLMRVVLSHDIILPMFFCYLFNGSPFVLAQVSDLSKGSTRDFLNQKILKSIFFPLPPLAEQQEIIRRVEALFKIADALEARYRAAKTHVDKLTQAILGKAFRGELVPQDPRDEAASVLLERIRVSSAQPPTRQPPNRVRLPKATRRISAMTKSRYDDDVKEKPYLANLLRSSNEPLPAEELFQHSELPLVDFYKQLSWEVDHGHIRDDAKRLEAA